jgi:hypothetical protein
MDDGEHGYFFMFLARLVSPPGDLRPNLAEIDDARWFTLDEMAALGKDQTWSGAIAVVRKALTPAPSLWPNHSALSDRSGIDVPDRWRIWM